ncbi:hypothetical protein [Pseudaminobacter sp. NGMCC 1.201702]|uniref:hypothetical protein n=1 Tax=Pseudaminobacter sp. NGMCC 1.201702 TaxID=3391825 RepID=UPI0039EEB758
MIRIRTLVAASAAALLASTASALTTDTQDSRCDLIRSTFRNHIETIFLVEVAHFHSKTKGRVLNRKIYDDALGHYNSRLSLKAIETINNECPFD